MILCLTIDETIICILLLWESIESADVKNERSKRNDREVLFLGGYNFSIDKSIYETLATSVVTRDSRWHCNNKYVIHVLMSKQKLNKYF